MILELRSASLLRVALGAAIVTGFAGSASATVVWDESVNGDLSNDRLAPSPFYFDAGVSSIKASTGFPDEEYFHINIPSGATLSALVLASYEGFDGIAFMGIQAGSVFTEAPESANPENLLGWMHFGPAFDQVGQNILPVLGTGPGSIGFIPPLASGDYTFWIQQLGEPVTYQLDFVVIPAPSGVFAFAAFAAIPLRRRRA